MRLSRSEATSCAPTPAGMLLTGCLKRIMPQPERVCTSRADKMRCPNRRGDEEAAPRNAPRHQEGAPLMTDADE